MLFQKHHFSSTLFFFLSFLSSSCSSSSSSSPSWLPPSWPSSSGNMWVSGVRITSPGAQTEGRPTWQLDDDVHPWKQLWKMFNNASSLSKNMSCYEMIASWVWSTVGGSLILTVETTLCVGRRVWCRKCSLSFTLSWAQSVWTRLPRSVFTRGKSYYIDSLDNNTICADKTKSATIWFDLIPLRDLRSI